MIFSPIRDRFGSGLVTQDRLRRDSHFVNTSTLLSKHICLQFFVLSRLHAGIAFKIKKDEIVSETFENYVKIIDKIKLVIIKNVFSIY